MSSGAVNPATVAGTLRLGAGFHANERDAIVDQLSGLNARLATFDGDSTELELSIKERDGHAQTVTLQCWIAGQPRLVARSTEETLANALADVRSDLRRQLNDAKTKAEPRHNRHLRVGPPETAESTG